MLIRVLRDFRDIRAKTNRDPGDTFEATEERFAEIARKLPGYVEAVEEEKTDLSTLKVADLRAMAEERGIEVPKKATKATLIELLEG